MRVVAIDGPAGAGKSTVARAVAEALGLEVLNTGAMYRAVTYAVIMAGADPTDNQACTSAASAANIELSDRVMLDGLDISDEIRGSLVTNEVSTVSAHPGVREVLVAKQRFWASQHGGAVVEGRDIGTVVFPDALVKVFLTASDAERARRRVIDEATAGREANVTEVEADLAPFLAIQQRLQDSLLREDIDGFVESSFDIMRAAFPFSNNPYLQETVENLLPAISRTYHLALERRKGEMGQFLNTFAHLLQAIIARDHHEKWDGSGYPDGKQAEQIHIYARIAALADVYDALRHRRCYKDAWTLQQVLAEIDSQAGKQFEPKLVAVFKTIVPKLEAILQKYPDSDADAV